MDAVSHLHLYKMKGIFDMKTVYYNGKIYTGSDELQEAFVVENNQFVFVGINEEALAMADFDDILIDLEGNFVCAGFNDSHMHLLGFGNMLNAAQLAYHTTSLSELLQCLCDFESTHPHTDGGWLIGRGWNQDYFTDTHRMPTRYDLDKVSTEVPICAIRACGHSLVVNSKVIEMLGITANTLQPDGGHIGIANGEPDGLFYDNAMDMIYSAIPVPNKETLKQMIVSACKELNAYGVTSCQTDDFCLFRQVPWQTVIDAYKELEQESKLTVRVYEQSNFTEVADLQEFVEAGNNTGVGTDMFQIGPLKMLGDGSLGSRTAFLSRPYDDDASTCGIPVFNQETMDALVDYANAHDMQVAVHAIGDACLDSVLSALEKALAKNPRTDHRHGIVHCQITRPDQLKKIADMNLHVYAQSIFLDYDIRMVEQRVGSKLASTSYSWKTLLKDGVSVSNGSDCPVELPDVMAGIQCAVTRKTLKDGVGPYLAHEAFTIKEAIDSYTIRGAEASFEESKKGQIKEGMVADFVVLEESPFEVNENRIKDIKVISTYLGGKNVFEA